MAESVWGSPWNPYECILRTGICQSTPASSHQQSWSRDCPYAKQLFGKDAHTQGADMVDSLCRDLESTAEDGSLGQLSSPQTVLDIAPLAGRLVLFLSGAVDHAVLPSYADRTALTAWFS